MCIRERGDLDQLEFELGYVSLVGDIGLEGTTV